MHRHHGPGVSGVRYPRCPALQIGAEARDFRLWALQRPPETSAIAPPLADKRTSGRSCPSTHLKSTHGRELHLTPLPVYLPCLISRVWFRACCSGRRILLWTAPRGRRTIIYSREGSNVAQRRKRRGRALFCELYSRGAIGWTLFRHRPRGGRGRSAPSKTLSDHSGRAMIW